MYQSIKKFLLQVLFAAGSLWVSCNNNSHKSNEIENHQHTKMEAVYACPMHSEVTGKKGDKCSICGMELTAVQHTESQYQMHLSSSPKRLESGKPARLTIAIKNNDKNVSLEVSHEKKLHLILVDEDLTWFHHLHPVQQTDSTLTVSETFPTGGKYLLYADYKPAGAKQNVSQAELEVIGDQHKRPVYDTEKLVSKVNDYSVRLVNGNDIKAGRTQYLEISIDKNSAKFNQKDLEPYLGAVAHIVMIGKSDKDYIHIHPMSNKDFPIYGETSIPKTGIYRIWVQFKVGGKVYTTDFTINVK